MQVLINGDKHLNLNGESIQQWQEEITDALERFSDWITRIEVHVTDENSAAKGGGDDIRCLMEARPKNHQPVSIEVHAQALGYAIRDAIDTLEKRLSTILEKARTEQRKSN